MKINLLLISTKKYWQYVQPLLEGVKKYFLINHEIEVHLFTDTLGRQYTGDSRVTITQELIPSYGFPLATLYRYKIFCSKKYTGDYIAYLDVDTAIVDFIDESILGDIVAVEHCGFSQVGGGSWGDNKLSTSYTYPENRIKYFAGGFQLGTVEKFYRLMDRMRRDIDEDERNGVMPEWHDETTFNFYLSEMKSFKILDSGYCLVENMALRKQWKLETITPKIIALDKNHSEIRS